MFRSDPSLLYAAITSLSSAFESLKKADGMSSSLTSFPPDYPFSGEVNAILSDVKSAKTDVSTLSRKISETKDRLCKLDNNFALAYYQSSVSSLNDFVGPLTDKQQMMKEMNQSKYESYLFNYLDDLNSKGLLTADMVDTYQYLKESKNYKQKIDELQKAEKELKSLKENAPSAPAVGGARLSQREAEELMKKSKEYSDYMQKKLALEKNIETLQKETGNYVNKWYEDFGEMFKKTGSAWSKGVNSALNGKGFGDLGVAVKQTAATGAVMAESALSGVNKIAEWVGDGIVAAGGTIASGLTVAGGAIDTARTWLYHDLWTGDNTAKQTMSNALNSASKIMDGTLDIVRQDTVGNLRKNFYENTYLGKSINENSNLKYDSAGAKAISKTTRIGVEALLATAAEVGTFGAATPLVGAMFALEGAGEATESYVQSVDREHGESYNYGKAVLNEALGGLGGYMKGKMYGKIGKNVLSVVDDPTLIAKGASTIKDKGIKNIILDDVRSTAFKVDAGMTAAQKAYEGIVEYNQTGTVDWKKLGLSYVSELITARVTDKLMSDNLGVTSNNVSNLSPSSNNSPNISSSNSSLSAIQSPNSVPSNPVKQIFTDKEVTYTPSDNEIFALGIKVKHPFEEQILEYAAKHGGKYVDYMGTKIPRELVFDNLDELNKFAGDTWVEKLNAVESLYGKQSIESVTAKGTLLQSLMGNDTSKFDNFSWYVQTDLSGFQPISRHIQDKFKAIGLDAKIYETEAEVEKLYSKHLDYWIDDINTGESIMRRFTGAKSEEMNKSLRDGAAKSIDEVNNLIKFSKQLDSMETLEDHINYRAVTNIGYVNQAFATQDLDKLVENVNALAGGKLQFGSDQFLSTTPVLGAGFTGNYGYDIIIASYVPKGTKGSYIGKCSTLPREVELTLQAGTYNNSVLLGAEKIGDKVVIYNYVLD